ncbi:HEAT repeat-containing protein 1 isoform X2 [Cephus cinctus]|nr:HEAT repeat-containing protein 1 isoform X2 [Cephus cinctus]
MIDRVSNITEVQITHILPSLIQGLASPITDYAASSYMIVAKLFTKVQLNDKTAEALMLKAFERAELHRDVLLVLLVFCESRSNSLTFIPEKFVQRFLELTWFTEDLAKIQSTGVKVAQLVPLLLEGIIRYILKDPNETEKIQTMLKDMFNRISLSDEEVDAILKNSLRKDTLSKKTPQKVKDVLAELYQTLEIRYPVRFDNYLKNLMRFSETQIGARKALHFLMTWHSGARDAKESLDIFNRLNHVNAEHRIAGLMAIAKDEVHISESFKDTINKSLLARFSDDDVRVVHALLNISTNRLKSLFTIDTLTEELMILLSKCHISSRMILLKPALKILLDLCEKGNDTSIFIAALPSLFPKNKDEVNIAIQVLKSDFAKNNMYMQRVLEDAGKCPNAESISSAAFHNILKWDLLPPTSNILSTMKLQSAHGDAASMFFNMILLGSVCRVPVGSLQPLVAREVIEIASQMIKQYPHVEPLPGCNQLNGDKIEAALELTSRGILPLQVGTYVMEMVHRRLDLNTNPKLDFEDDPDRSELVLRILEIFFDGMANKEWREHYAWCLKIFFRRHFSTVENMLCFLSQLFTKPISPQTSLHCIQISLSLLNRSKFVQWIFNDKVFTPNLLLALSSQNLECRKAAVEILTKLSQTFNISMDGFSSLLHELAARKSEITIDPDQLSLALYTLLSPDSDVQHHTSGKLRNKLQEARTLLLDIIVDKNTPVYIVSQLLDILAHVNGPSILEQLAPLGLELLQRLKIDPQKKFAGNALKNILEHFIGITAKALTNNKVWKLFEESMMQHDSQIFTKKGYQPPSVILIKQIDEVFFDSVSKVDPQLSRKILAKLVDVVTDCEIGNVVAAGNRAVRRIRIDAQLVVDELERMEKARVPDNADQNSVKKIRMARMQQAMPNPELFNSRDWKRGITLLEFIQRADNIEREELLLPVLFDLLRMCLGFEEHSPLEYTNQLLLSSIYHLATKSLPIPDAHLHVDLIAQCIRTSRNPQTHHHALLLLVELFRVADMERALHSIMPIFTFMGSSVLRQDDAYSIQIISKTIETIVPVVNAANNERHACEILRVFISSLPDIPEHRRVPLFVKLLQLLENHLHLFYLLTFESHVLSQCNEGVDQQKSSERLEFALSISHEFSPRQLIGICVKLLEFMRLLPVEIEDERRKQLPAFPGKHIFDVSNNSAKQLRHYKYTLVQFLSALLSAPEFVTRVASLDSSEISAMNDIFDKLIVELVVLIQSASKSADIHLGKSKGKYWKVLLHHLYDVLDVVNGLLPNKTFIASIKRLLAHDITTVRRKALELLNARLQQKKFNQYDHEDLLSTIDAIVRIVEEQDKTKSSDYEVIQQTALISLKLLAKSLATDHPNTFKPILELSTELVRTRNGPVLASGVLCVAELCSAMRVHAIQSLNKFVPAILRLLEKQCNQEVPDLVVVSIVSALQKIVESVGNFLSLYLDQLLFELSRLNSLYTDTEHPKIELVASRLKATAQRLSNCIPLRVLLPAVSRTYDAFISNKSYECVGPLMSVLAESFANIQPGDLNAAIQDLTTFFLKVLQFREDFAKDEHSMEIDEEGGDMSRDIKRIEECASKSLVALVLKLSEATFRPLYYKLYDWAARNPHQKQRNITFYRLSATIAECLKSLFVLFAGQFLNHAATLLGTNNLAVTEESNEFLLEDEAHRVELIEAILLTLHRVFTYDAHNFVNQERFETLAQPIIDQIENTMGTVEEYERRAKDLLVPCVASFAGATPDDSLHKQLVYQILLKTRHNKSHVRSTALSALVEIARKLGVDFMPLLPETVPFLAELLEDEDEATEKHAQNAVRTLEEILGEPLQKYF